VRPVAPKYFMSEAELAAERAHGEKSAPAASELEWSADPSSKPVAVAAWLVVGIPLAWGVWITLQKTVVLFQ
ncbi:MAG: MFS transporter, partial [Pseudomonas sp.]|nr:MFS transporter [Pseudomonas sp.]